MLLQFRFMRQQSIQDAIQTVLVDPAAGIPNKSRKTLCSKYSAKRNSLDEFEIRPGTKTMAISG